MTEIAQKIEAAVAARVRAGWSAVVIVVMSAARPELTAAAIIAAAATIVMDGAIIVTTGRLTGVAIVALEQAAQLMAQLVSKAFATARIAVIATPRRRGGSRHRHGLHRWGRNFLLSRLADQHGPCYQQERSIHEDSSNSG
jgi:hypothetical protein